MNFSQRKLARDWADRLVQQPVAETKPWELLASPVYVYLRANEKFVAIKGPLDFFSESELAKFSAFESFFVLPIAEDAVAFRDAGRSIRQLLLATQMHQPSRVKFSGTITEEHAQKSLGPAPYELADAALQRLGPLWYDPMTIEPFFIAVFADAVCGPLDASLIATCRETNVAQFERALLLAGIGVFLAVLAGQCDLAWLENTRMRIIQREVFGKIPDLYDLDSVAIDELTLRIFSEDLSAISKEAFDRTILNDGHRLSVRIRARLERVEQELMTKDTDLPTIFGERGFIRA